MKLSELGIKIDELVAAGHGDDDVEVWMRTGLGLHSRRLVEEIRVLDTSTGEVICFVVSEVRS